MSTRILIADSNPAFAQQLRSRLEERGLLALVVPAGQDLEGACMNFQPDLIYLDCKFPEIALPSFCKAARRISSRIVIVLSGWENSESDRIHALEGGADDFLGRPMGMQELLARIAAHLRRSNFGSQTGQNQPAYQFGELSLDIERRTVSVGGELIPLTAREFELLWFLARHTGRSFSTGELLSAVWGYNGTAYRNTVKTHVNRLRSKILRQRSSHQYIHNRRGLGYSFSANVEETLKKAA